MDNSVFKAVRSKGPATTTPLSLVLPIDETDEAE